MSDADEVVGSYIAMWNETDSQRRRGEPIAIGVDFATVADDGRMRSVTGFLEPAA
jgi:hypothetical protein